MEGREGTVQGFREILGSGERQRREEQSVVPELAAACVGGIVTGSRI